MNRHVLFRIAMTLIALLVMAGCASKPKEAPKPLPPIIKLQHPMAAKQTPPRDYSFSEAGDWYTDLIQKLPPQPRITLDFPNRSLQDAFADIQLEIIALGHDIQIVVSDTVQGMVNTRFEDEELPWVIDALCKPSGYFWTAKKLPNGSIYYYIGSATAGDPAALDLWLTEKVYTDRPAYVVQGLLSNPMFAPYISAVMPIREEERRSTRRTYTTTATQHQSLLGERKIESHELIISGPRPIVEHIKKVIKTVVDTPRRQVAISVMFTESSFNKGHQIGIDWSRGLDLSVSGQVTKSKNFEFGWQSIAMGELLSAIQAMVQRGELELKDYPRIATLENTQATIHLQTEEKYRVDRPRTLGDSFVYRERIETVITEVILRVTPVIKDNQDVYLTIDAEVDDFAGYNADGLPVVHKRYVSSEICVASGETVVIGGLYQDLMRSGKASLAGIGQLPIIGLPFSQSEKRAMTKEMTVFITAQILEPEWVTPVGSDHSQVLDPEWLEKWEDAVQHGNTILKNDGRPAGGE